MSDVDFVIENITLKQSSPRTNHKSSASTALRRGLSLLKVGQSFFLPATHFSSRRYAQIKTCQRAKELGIRAVMRDDSMAKAPGYRFFRIE